MLDKFAIFKNPLFDYTLTVLLLTQLFIIPFFPEQLHNLLFNIVGTLMYINLVLVVKNFRGKLIVIVFVLFVFDWILFFFGNNLLSTFSSILNMLLFFGIVTVFIASLAKTKQVDIKIILHAINGYLLLGVISGIGIELIMLLNSASISFPVQADLVNDGIGRLAEYQYFGICTLTTLGYGEIIPISPIARSFATFITMAGQMYLAIIIAMLVGKYSSKKD